MLYDADKVEEAAFADEKDLYHAQLDIFLDPNDPEVIEEALKEGIPMEWIEAAQKSPIYKMIVDWKIALPLHPEYRTLPMVWYIPPLSPIMNQFEGIGSSLNEDEFFRPSMKCGFRSPISPTFLQPETRATSAPC